MPKSKVTSIVWTARSLQHAISIKEYLENNFSAKEIEVFYSLLESFEIAVCAYPEIYPQSGVKKNIRKAVLSKVLSTTEYIKGKLKSLQYLTIDVILEIGCSVTCKGTGHITHLKPGTEGGGAEAQRAKEESHPCC